MSREEIREKLRKLEESFIEGRISEETYKELKAKYEAELASAGIEPTKPSISAEGLGDLFSKAADFCSNNPVVFVPPVLSGIISAIIYVILGVSAFGMFRGFKPAQVGPIGPGVPTPSLYGFLAITALASIIVMVISLVFNGWTIAMVKHGVEENFIDLNSSFSYTLSKLAPLLVASILVGLIIGIGLVLCVIPGIIAAILLALTLQAVVVDDYGAVEALSISYNVVKKNFFEVLIVIIVQFVVAAILGMIPYVGAILAGLSGAYFTVLLTLLYYSRRAPKTPAFTV